MTHRLQITTLALLALLSGCGFSTYGGGGGGSGTDLTGLGADNAISRWDGADTLQSSGWTISDADVMTSGGALVMTSSLALGGTLVANNHPFEDLGTLIFDESADHDCTPVAGTGCLWVRNDAPNVLVYTDDSGADTVLGGGKVTLTDGANIATDASLGDVFEVTLGGNRTLDNPTNLQSGHTYLWIVKQDATGERTLAYGTLFKWPGGTVPTLSTAANAVDVISGVYDGTSLLVAPAKDFQ